MRQESPGATGPQPVHQRVEDLPPRMLRRSPTRLDRRNQRTGDLPLLIGQIRRVTGTQPAYPSPRKCVTTPLPGTCPLKGFSDALWQPARPPRLHYIASDWVAVFDLSD